MLSQIIKGKSLYLFLGALVGFWGLWSFNPFFYNWGLNSAFQEYYEAIPSNYAVSLLDNKTFFIHPQEEESTSLKINIKKDGNYRLKLGIHPLKGDGCIYNEEAGIIAISFYKNGERQDSLLATRSHSQTYNLDLKTDDNLFFDYHKHHITACDWGLLSLKPAFYFADGFKIIIVYLLILSGCYFFIKRKDKLHLVLFVGFLLLFFAAEYSTHAILRFPSTLWHIFFAFSLVLCLETIRTRCTKLPTLLLSTALLLVCTLPFVAFIMHKTHYNMALNEITLYAVFQSNLQESIEYLIVHFSWKYLLVFIFSYTVVLYFLLRKKQPKKQPYITWLGLIIIATCFFTHSHSHIFWYITNTYKIYKNELTQLQAEINARKTERNYTAESSSENETIVLIIGESQNKHHLGIYGYPRNTTPFLRSISNELIVLQNAFSVHTQTIFTVPYAITSANTTKHKDVSLNPSLLEIFNLASYDTYWISNQNRAGMHDNPYAVLANEAKYLIHTNKSVGGSSFTTSLDENLIPHFKKALQNKNKKLIILHLMGSHEMYQNRYPTPYYTALPQTDTFGVAAYNSDCQHRINAYDNTIRYFDSNMQKIIALLKEQEEQSTLIYFSDHGENIHEDLKHDVRTFHWDMTQIGVFVWSNAVDSVSVKKRKTLAKNASSYFPNDKLFDLTLGLSSVETDLYEPKYDLSNPQFTSFENLYTSYRHYDTIGNPHFQLNENLQFVKDSIAPALREKLLTHRANSIGKALYSQHLGLPNFEIDITYLEEEKQFRIGHGRDELNNISLEAFLEKIQLNAVQKIWFDVKNLNDNNLEEIITHLLALDEKFQLNHRIILESPLQSTSIAKLAAFGFHTSYYLPTADILDMLTNKKNEEVTALATQIQQTIKQGAYQAISYDVRLLPFVEKHLLHLHKPHHVWATGTDFQNVTFKNELLPILQKEYIKTVLVPLHTRFDF